VIRNFGVLDEAFINRLIASHGVGELAGKFRAVGLELLLQETIVVLAQRRRL